MKPLPAILLSILLGHALNLLANPESMRKEMSWRAYPYPQDHTGGVTAIQAVLRQIVFELPEGSEWVANKAADTYFLRTTAAGHEQLRELYPSINKSLIQIQLRLVRFEADFIDRLDRKAIRGLSSADVVGLWRTGRGKTSWSTGVTTYSGVNAVMEEVEEIVYPTESVETRRDGTPVEAAASAMETRSAGTILNITPQLNASKSTVSLVLVPEKVVFDGNRTDLQPQRQALAPLFRAINVSTQVDVKPNTTSVIGSHSSEDGRYRDYLLISVDVLDAKGKPLTQQNEEKDHSHD